MRILKAIHLFTKRLENKCVLGGNKMDTKLKEIIQLCKKDTPKNNCAECLCNKKECLMNLLDLYNSNCDEFDYINYEYYE